jgi:16S rRNA processing protein RimM
MMGLVPAVSPTIKFDNDLGKVTELMETGSNDVLVVEANVKDAFGAKERLIPFLEEQVIKNIDLTARTIEVDWDPGF